MVYCSNKDWLLTRHNSVATLRLIENYSNSHLYVYTTLRFLYNFIKVSQLSSTPDIATLSILSHTCVLVRCFSHFIL